MRWLSFHPGIIVRRSATPARLEHAVRYLLLSDGTVYSGAPLGADTDAIGEVVINTGMTGYQEVLSDPSYAGQIRPVHLSPHRQLRDQRRRFRVGGR